MLKSKRGKAAELVVCETCGDKFLKEVCNIRQTNHNYCSQSCRRNDDQFMCAECNTPVSRKGSEINKNNSGRYFCCQSHAATYNNRLREKTRRSKIEAAFYDRLVAAFPDIEMLPNDKTMLPGMEVDIAIPSLSLGIEWNGVVHLQPIYGQEKLEIIQRRDAMKSDLAAELDIRLVTISDHDSSKKTLERAFDEVSEIIVSLLQ